MTSSFEVCPKCATKSFSVYDRRWVVVRDAPLRNAQARFVIRKRRFACRPCGRPFTEPVHGVGKGKRTTERFAREVTEACERYVDLSRVRRQFRGSAGYLYATLYRYIRLKQREKRSDWPRKVGLDDHSFKRRKGFNRRELVTMVVDQSNGRLMEVAEGRRSEEVEQAVSRFTHPENVGWVSIDWSAPYRKFAQPYFPNAKIVADKFHVLRLLSGPLTKHRRLAEQGRHNP